METHEHCQMCINVTRCRKWNSKKDFSCGIVRCHLNCGATFHACKEPEHKLLCDKEKVRCINADYGCPVVMERKDKGKHLKLCPASVVHCNMTYDHWPIPLVDNVALGSSGSDGENSELKSNLLSDQDQSCSTSSSGLNLSTYSDISVSVRNSGLAWKSFKQFTLNPKEHYTFTCAKDFQRLEFEWHFRNTHSDLQSCLYDWVEQWCPLAQYGCKFTRQRLKPCLQANGNCGTNPASKIVFSQQLEAFGVAEEDSLPHSESLDRIPNGSEDYLCPRDLLSRLPSEVLLVIAGHLDSFSLNNLSLTSKRFQAICQSLLTQKGIVLPHWEKVNQKQTSWRIACYRWQFSVACAPVHNWLITDSAPMSAHMRDCPHFSSCLSMKKGSTQSDIKDNQVQRSLLMDVVKEYASRYPNQR